MRRSLSALLLTLAISGVTRTGLSDLLIDSVSPAGSSTLADSFTDIRGQSGADCGCSSARGLSGGSDLSVQNNTDCLTGLTESMVLVLDANPELPGYYYGEEPINGWIAVSDRALEFRFEALGIEGLPLSGNVYLDNTPGASIVFPPAYEFRPFAVLYQSRVYCGTILEGDMFLTAVPEPSISISLLAGMASLGLYRMHRVRQRNVSQRLSSGVCQ